MARRALGPASLEVVQAVAAVLEGPALVACSGGPDSLALAAATAVAARRRSVPVRAVVIDHQLQPGSGEQAARVVDQLANLDLAALVVPVRVSHSGGLEAAARQARYDALSRAAGAAEDVLLGHTLDDQAETVLLGLARGSGARAVAGMAPRRGRFVRPLLGIRATVTAQACAEFGLQPWLDPHNQDSRFARSRVRTRVMPLLEAELGPGIAQALARTAGLIRQDTELLEELALQHGDPSQPSLGSDRLAELAPALRGRLLREWLNQHGATDLNSVHLAAVDSLVTQWRGQRWVDLPGVRVRRRDDRLWVESASSWPAPSPAGSG